MVTFDYIPGKRKGQVRCEETILDFIRNHFSVKNEAKAHVRDVNKRKHLPDRNYAVTPTGLFDFGLYNEIRKFLISEQITEIVFTDEFKNRLKCGIKDWVFWDKLKYESRYFQKEIIEKCLTHGYGTYLLATGGGKSLAQALLIENYKRNNSGPFKCIIIVPGIGLVEQLTNDFKDYGVTFTYSGWTGEKLKGKGQSNKQSKPLQDTEVIICNSENFSNQFGANPWIVDVTMYIQDECHRINSKSGISKLVTKIKTPNRFGFTGTLSDVQEDRWKTLGTFGPVMYEKNSKELRDEGFLTQAQGLIIKLIHDQKKVKYKDELTYIYNSEKRNGFIKKLAAKFNNNTLILVNHLEQGENLFDILSQLDRKVYFVNGDMPVEERERIKSIMETDNDIIVIAMAAIFSTGINIKNIHYILLVGLGKAFIRLVQTIGRGLRLHEAKHKLTIVDLYDNIHYSSLHMEKRKSTYDLEHIPWKETEIIL